MVEIPADRSTDYGQGFSDGYAAAIGEIIEYLRRVEPPPAAIVATPIITLDTVIEEAGLSARTTNCLSRNGYRTVRQLVQSSDRGLLDLRNFGPHHLEEVKGFLSRHRLERAPLISVYSLDLPASIVIKLHNATLYAGDVAAIPLDKLRRDRNLELHEAQTLQRAAAKAMEEAYPSQGHMTGADGRGGTRSTDLTARPSVTTISPYIHSLLLSGICQPPKRPR